MTEDIVARAAARLAAHEKVRYELLHDGNKGKLTDKALSVLNKGKIKGEELYKLDLNLVIALAEKLIALDKNMDCQATFDKLSNEFLLMLPICDIEAVYVKERAVQWAAELTIARNNFAKFAAELTPNSQNYLSWASCAE